MPTQDVRSPDQRSRKCIAALEPTDSELLFDFVENRRHEAFAELVGKHAAMVLGVCRQILRNSHDAEDAFQATFLSLATKAPSVRSSASLGAWLHRVAYRTAMRAAKRRQRDSSSPLEDVPGDDEVWLTITQREEQTALHEELAHLPERYRAVLVLCYLEGMSRNDAADELEASEAAVKARLARARRMLRIRLTRRGIVLSTALGVAGASSATAEASTLSSLVTATVNAGTSTLITGSMASVTPNIAALAREGVQVMKWSTTLHVIAPAVLFFGVGAALLIVSSSDGQASAATPYPPQGNNADTIVVSSKPSGELPLQSTRVTSIGVEDPTVASEDAALKSDDTAGNSEPAAPVSERQLEVDYFTAKITAMERLAEAKRLAADVLTKRVTLAKTTNQRIAGTIRETEIIDLEAQAALAMAETADARAEVIRLRMEKLAAQRRLEQENADASAQQTRHIQVGDALTVEFATSQENSLLQRQLRVEAEGTIPLGALHGRVEVEGLTLAEAEEKLEEQLKKYYRSVLVQITFQ